MASTLGVDRPVVGVEVGSSLVLLVKLATRTLGEAIPEDDAIAVIGLVLQTPREESGAGDRERIAPRILPLAGGMVGTLSLIHI